MHTMDWINVLISFSHFSSQQADQCDHVSRGPKDLCVIVYDTKQWEDGKSEANRHATPLPICAIFKFDTEVRKCYSVLNKSKTTRYMIVRHTAFVSSV